MIIYSYAEIFGGGNFWGGELGKWVCGYEGLLV